MRATPFLSFSCWNNFFYDYQCLRQGCSGAGTRGNGVPTPFSRFALKWIGSIFEMAIFWCVPIPFFLALHPWLKRTVEQRSHHENNVGWLLFTLLAVQTDWAQSYPRKHVNSTTPLQERYFPTPFITSCKKQPLYWKWANLSLQSSLLQPPKLNVDKPT